MIVVSVLYPAGPEGSIDYGYYHEKHLPLVEARWRPMGLQELKVLKGIGAPGGGPATYQLIAELSFPSLEHFEKAAAAHGAEVMGDVAAFTKLEPVVQISDVA